MRHFVSTERPFETVPIAGSKHRLEDLPERFPLFFEGAMCVVMPCCGFSFDYGHEDTVPGKPMELFDPPRWTCPCCERTYTVGYLGLDEIENVRAVKETP